MRNPYFNHSRLDPGRREKINLNFYFHTSLWWKLIVIPIINAYYVSEIALQRRHQNPPNKAVSLVITHISTDQIWLLHRRKFYIFKSHVAKSPHLFKLFLIYFLTKYCGTSISRNWYILYFLKSHVTRTLPMFY